MATYSQTISANTTFALEFSARQITVENPTGSWLYIRLTGTDYPDAKSADLAIKPYKSKALVINPSRLFAVTVDNPSLATPAQAGIVVSFNSQPQGNSQDDLDATLTTQTVNLGSVPGIASVTLGFSARRIMVANIGGFFIYLKLNALTGTPAPGNCDFVIAPYCYYEDNIPPTRDFIWQITQPVAPISNLFGGMTLTAYDKEN